MLSLQLYHWICEPVALRQGVWTVEADHSRIHMFHTICISILRAGFSAPEIKRLLFAPLETILTLSDTPVKQFECVVHEVRQSFSWHKYRELN
jgi:hypothetical protein